MLWQGSLGLLENVSATDAGGDLLSQWSFAPDTAYGPSTGLWEPRLPFLTTGVRV